MESEVLPSKRHRSFVSKKSFIRGIIVGISISILISILSFLGLLSGWENRAFDFMMWWQKEKRSSEIFLIEIDSQDYKDLFHAVSPLSREILARVIDKLSMAEPRAICLDISLRDRTAEDPHLVETLSRLEKRGIPVVLASSIQEVADEGKIRSAFSRDFPYACPDNVLFGATNFPISENETIREMRLLRRMDDGRIYPYISLSIIAASEGISWPAFQTELDRANRSASPESKVFKNLQNLIRTGLRHQRQKIYFVGNKTSFNVIKISDIDKMPRESFQAGSIFSQKILLVGGTFTESKDFYRTPKGIMSGVEIIANSAEALLSSKPIRPINYLLSLLFEFVIVLVLSSMFLRFPLGKATILSALSVIPLTIIGSQVAFASMNRWLDFLPVALAVVLHGEASLIEHYRSMKKEIRDLRSQLCQKEQEASEGAPRLGPPNRT
jgi:CHASE2 domain-containing sensor protein